MNQIAVLLTPINLVLNLPNEGKPRIIPVNSKTKDIMLLCREYNTSMMKGLVLDKILELLIPIRNIIKTSNGQLLQDEDGQVFLVNTETPIPVFLSNRLLDFLNKELPIEYILEFWRNCLLNPEPKVITDLFQFLEAHHYPITDDGCFLGYKKVTSTDSFDSVPDEFKGIYTDKGGMVRYSNGYFVPKEVKVAYLAFIGNREPTFVDSHTNTIKQSIGDVIFMDRKDCDFNKSKLCSTGFHIGSYEYSKSFSGDVFIYCKINPMNVTSIPAEYGNGKLRCCEYTIVGFAEEAEMTKDVYNFEGSLFDRDNNPNTTQYDFEEDEYEEIEE